MQQVIVDQLSKSFGAQKAVNNISFSANQGQILGFLGPNGAGKSTTMKMICGFSTQDQGSITVCGKDTIKDPLAVKQHIGYLPEQNPMYLEMYVREFLTWLCGIHKVDKNRINEVIEQVGLTDEQNKIIGTLSKGYKQRVGLAQAILHDPDILILDEPTSGLDPNQLVEIRNLIKELGKAKTVIFSSHILQEVQAICDRVVIINKGVLVADKNIDELKSSANGSLVIRVKFESQIDPSEFQKLSHVHQIKNTTEHSYDIFADKDIRAEIFDFAVTQSNRILEMSMLQEDMESIFSKLTQNV